MATQRLVDVRNKLAETVEEVDAMMGEAILPSNLTRAFMRWNGAGDTLGAARSNMA